MPRLVRGLKRTRLCAKTLIKSSLHCAPLSEGIETRELIFCATIETSTVPRLVRGLKQAASARSFSDFATSTVPRLVRGLKLGEQIPSRRAISRLHCAPLSEGIETFLSYQDATFYVPPLCPA